MKIFRFLFLILIAATLFSCTGEDDICTNSEGTPRLKLKFKDSNNKLIRLNSLFIDVDYGTGLQNVTRQTAVDSVMVPLKIDGSGFTDLVIHTAENGTKSTLRVNYSEESQYVSPACGIRRLYKNVTYELRQAEPVKNIEPAQNEIINENKTGVYLIF